MTENKIVEKDTDKSSDVELALKDIKKDINLLQQQQQQQQQQPSQIISQKEQQQQPKTEQHDSRFRRLSQFLDLLNIPRHHSGGSSSSSNNSQQHSPQTPHAANEITPAERRISQSSNPDAGFNSEQEQQQNHFLHQSTGKRSSCVSFRSETLLFDLVNGEINDLNERSQTQNSGGNSVNYSTQRIYKKSSPNCVLTLYLPSREIILSGNSPSVLGGVVFIDAKDIQDYRIYAQLALTFRYGREDEEVMGLRFCNEAIMSLQQIWPRKEDPHKPLISPLQEALLKRLGEGAHPFTLTLTAQAPPSVQLVPAKRYYGAPIGTSYDVRCFIADKTDEKFNRRASVKMGVRVIYRTDVFSHGHRGPGNFTNLLNNPTILPTVTSALTNTNTTTSSPIYARTADSSDMTVYTSESQQTASIESNEVNSCETDQPTNKSRKSERGDSFPKLRLSPKSFRFSTRFGRSKSEVDKCSSDAFYNYSKSFQEYDSVYTTGCSGPQGAVDKPFLLQDGRVGLRASLDKAWYTHGEEVCVTIHIHNDSKKTVRKIRVCAIQHVDVCMFNNGKFKNVVADSDNLTSPPMEQHVAPYATLNTTVILKPKRGATKNWIALEDTLQRSTEPDEINASIAASAVRTPHFLMQSTHSPTTNSAVPTPAMPAATPAPTNPTQDERNVFAIYVSYYVKVKLTLSGMGGELSLKLPFMLVHIDEEQRRLHKMQKLSLEEVPSHRAKENKIKIPLSQEFALVKNLDRIESVDEGNLSNKASPSHVKAQAVLRENNKDAHQTSNERRRIFKRSETLAKDLDADDQENIENKITAQVHSSIQQQNSSSLEGEDENLVSSTTPGMVKEISNTLATLKAPEIPTSVAGLRAAPANSV